MDAVFLSVQPTPMDVHTMVEFVRLMRWQHRERWKLQQRGAAARALDQLADSTSIVCSVCYHKNYFGFVLCGCTAGLPICFNHRESLLDWTCNIAACLILFVGLGLEGASCSCGHGETVACDRCSRFHKWIGLSSHPPSARPRFSKGVRDECRQGLLP
jgi:hypothetical protein